MGVRDSIARKSQLASFENAFVQPRITCRCGTPSLTPAPLSLPKWEGEGR